MLSGRKLSKSYGKEQVLNQIDLDLLPGEVTAIIGPSGSGKSTLLRLLAFLEEPDSGTITLDKSNMLLEDVPDHKKWPTVSTVFQQLHLWPHLTLRENIELPIRLAALQESLETVETLVDQFSLRAAIDRYPNQVSIGQRQRAALIRALALKPRYLLLDEITSALDIEHIGLILDQVVREKTKGMSILLVTHFVEFASRSADNVLFLDNGSVIERGDSSILSNPQTNRLSEFLSLVRLAT